MDNHSNGGSNDRYSDRPSSSSSSAWANPNNGPPSSVKSFGGLQSVTNDVWVSFKMAMKNRHGLSHTNKKFTN